MHKPKNENRTRHITPTDIEKARRLNALWELRRGQLELTQDIVKKSFGVTQSAVSQMLHGKMALTTDMILKWAEILRVIPERIDPALASIRIVDTRDINRANVPVIFSIGTMRVVRHTIIVNTMNEKAPLYGVEVNSTEFEPYIPKGGVLIVDPSKDIRPGTKVVVRYVGPEADLFKIGFMVSQGIDIELKGFDDKAILVPENIVIFIHAIESVIEP